MVVFRFAAPELYKISVDIGQDDKIDRIGFRLIDIAGGRH
jgi:hypothetical protein